MPTLTGETGSSDFPTVNPLQPDFGGQSIPGNGFGDAFVAKLNAAGTALVYSTYLGGSSSEFADFGGGIAVDSSGNAYVTGSTDSFDFPTANPLQSALHGMGDAFVAKIASAVMAIPVVIDIKPGDFPNSINPRSNGSIPVAILTTDSFDASSVDPSTVRFGGKGREAAPLHSSLEDVDGDGDLDLVLHFDTQQTGLQCGDSSAHLTGKTFDAQELEGSDSVRTVGCD
jgi:beta-propeller repeat-containing protein